MNGSIIGIVILIAGALTFGTIGCSGGSSDADTDTVFSPEETAEAFINILLSGDLMELEHYLVPEERGITEEAQEMFKDWFSTATDDISISTANIRIQRLWATDTKVAIKAMYDVEGKMSGHKVSIPAEDTFLLELRSGQWLVSQWGDIPSSPPVTTKPVPTPTPEPVMATATPVEATTGSTQPVGDLLFADDFHAPSDYWETYSDAYGIAYYSDEALYVKHRGCSNDMQICNLNRSLDDFALDIDTSPTHGGTGSWITIICRCDHWDNGYHFLMNPAGYYAIAEQTKRCDQKYLQEPVASPYIKTGNGALNHLRIACKGDTLSLEINGYPVSEVQSDTFSEGALGLGITVESGTHGAEGVFDNLRITTPVN